MKPNDLERREFIAGVAALSAAGVCAPRIREASECLHYALSLPTSVVINGCESMERLDQAFEAARTFKPVSEAEMAKLLERTRQAAMTGKFEPFKTTARFDGTAHHPEWLG